MTEAELFAAYRTVDGWESECACGDVIRCEHGDELNVARAVSIHNESTIHAQWATWQEAVHALQRPTRRPCPCHGVA